MAGRAHPLTELVEFNLYFWIHFRAGKNTEKGNLYVAGHQGRYHWLASERLPRTGGEGGIRTRPFSEPSCYQGDGENPYKHRHSITISFPSSLSNVAPFNCISAFLELMELMHP